MQIMKVENKRKTITQNATREEVIKVAKKILTTHSYAFQKLANEDNK